jgi:glycosyltransferase involved in cell wall biosynthesis
LLIVSFSVCPAPDRHGVGLLNVLKALASRYSVDALTLRPPHGEQAFNERFGKTHMLRVPVGRERLAENVEVFHRAIRRQLEGEDYDVVHLRSAWGARAVLAGMPAPGRVVYEVARSTEGEPRAADEALAAALAAEEALCLERADLVLVPTEDARRHLAARGLGGRVEVVPPGVDVDHFDWEPSPPVDAVPRVLYAGQIAPGRGVRLLAEAVGLVRQKRAVKLVLAGAVEESFRARYAESVARGGLGPEDVDELGPIDHEDVPRLMAQATVCVAPATLDHASRPLAGFPTKLLEYMACRRAVVAPRLSSVEEVVTDGRDGLLFEPGSADDLARAILRLLDEPELRAALADSGYRRVRNEYPASATRRRLLAAYARLLPPSEWAPPSRAASPIDALPSHPDTTQRRVLPWLQPVPAPRELVIEADDWASAGEALDAQMDGVTIGTLPSRRNSGKMSGGRG